MLESQAQVVTDAKQTAPEHAQGLWELLAYCRFSLFEASEQVLGQAGDSRAASTLAVSKETVSLFSNNLASIVAGGDSLSCLGADAGGDSLRCGARAGGGRQSQSHLSGAVSNKAAC